MRTTKKKSKRHWKPVRRKELAGGTLKETQQISEWQCGVCDHLYEDETEEEEVWIECSQCQLWYHVGCVHINNDIVQKKSQNLLY